MGLGDEMTFIGAGFGLVLTILALLWLISALIGRLYTAATAPKAPAAVAAPVAAPAPVATNGVPAHHLAAISAAVAMMTDGRGRVVSVRLPAHLATAWAQEGRIEHFSSHRVRSDWAIPGPRHVEREPTKRS
jgi:Na+-transporting methylmalonyl-CoA/oxaloacetate decarboxylase gamma subunit